MSGPAARVTLDTNIAIYAFGDEGLKSTIAVDILAAADFASVQLLNEFANVMSRKHGRAWHEVAAKVEDIRLAVGSILPLDVASNAEALRIAARYQLNFYDALMLAVALSGGARTFYSEDMQHDMIVDDTLRIVDPFHPDHQ